MEDAPTPDTEVRSSPRRTFTLAYKQRILAEFDACEVFGQKAALLRREGLYDAHISKWRAQMKRDLPRRGRPPKTDTQRRLEKAEAENARLRADLEKANLIIEVQKKLCDVLESVRKTQTSDAPSSTGSSSSGKPSR